MGQNYVEYTVLALYIADFEAREEAESLTKSEVKATFKRLEKFLNACIEIPLYEDLEETTPEYGLARNIYDRHRKLRRVDLYLLSERILSSRLKSLDASEVSGKATTYHIWDISRLARQREATGQKEALDIDLVQEFGTGIPCLEAHLGEDMFRSYLLVVPGKILARLYDQYGARLLEQNVRCFLQARGKVNKGIRITIINEPHMFFAYNNGLTATAQQVELRNNENGLEIVRLHDLQIVNGGQTTASIFNAALKENADLEHVFVQMKLSVIEADAAEKVVPRISEYANTQNKVNAADFFSNHPFHIRMEEFSRRLWAPTKDGAQRETRWFYERARGQYADACSTMKPSEKKKFVAEHPKPQMFTKTDLAKFENVWDEPPIWVSRGSQKNFARYAERIGKAWDKNPDQFNEYYFKRVVARAICFRTLERLIPKQSWYQNGYRANIVCYTHALLNAHVTKRGKTIDYMKIWDKQVLPGVLEESLLQIAELANGILLNPPETVRNISEWAKRESCWDKVSQVLPNLGKFLPGGFDACLVSGTQSFARNEEARRDQKTLNRINLQLTVVEKGAEYWFKMADWVRGKPGFSHKELSILEIACRLPERIPSEKQCYVLCKAEQRAIDDGFIP